MRRKAVTWLLGAQLTNALRRLMAYWYLPTRHKAVTWLLGAQLTNALRRLIAYWYLRRRLDQRNWMTATVHSFTATIDFWWDYVADTGDDELAMLDIAALLYSDLYLDGTTVRRATKGTAPPAGECLPRGQFLFVGGDTAYHVANRATLEVQFGGPFREAWSAVTGDDFTRSSDVPRRPIFGLPGNHDYFDEIQGFGLQFRQTIGGEDHEVEIAGKRHGAALRIPSFERVQGASYIRIELPYGWELWGLDLEIGTIDPRQIEFFRASKSRKLIVATPEPSTVNGERCSRSDKIVAAFTELGLAMPFLETPFQQRADSICYELAPDQCRLDISGDTHNYQRYFGPTVCVGVGEMDGATLNSANARKIDSAGGSGGANLASRYASVVSGGGGAFMHPTEVDYAQIPPEVRFPSPDDSHHAISARCMDLRQLLEGGAVAFVGAVVAMAMYVAATHVPTSRSFFDAVLARTLQLCPTDGCGISIDSQFFAHGLVALAVVVCALLFYAANRVSQYSKPRTQQHNGKTRAQRLYSSIRYAISVALVVIGLALPWAVTAFATKAQARFVFADEVVWLLLIALFFGLAIMAWTLGVPRRSLRIKLMFVGFAEVLALVVVLLPVELARMQQWLPVFAVVVVMFALWAIARFHLFLNYRRRVSVVLFALGTSAAALYVPSLVSNGHTNAPTSTGMSIVMALAAGALGWVTTATALGWYFAVCLQFGGHGNEAASVARVANYKQFIRFKLNVDGLTAYVIGLREAREIEELDRDGNLVLIDTFTIRSAPPTT
jgi:hypothetical protein